MNRFLHSTLTISITLFSLCGKAQSTIQSNSTGNWNTSGTWVGGAIPGVNDSVVINNSHTITVDMPGSGNSKCKSLEILNGGIIEFRSTTAATLQIGNTLNIESGGTLRTASGTNITGHRLEVTGNVANAATLNLNRNTLALGGNITGSGTTTADSVNTYIELNGSSGQTINTTFNNSKIANLKVYNTASITNSVAITNSILLYNGALSCGGTLTLGNGGTNSFAYTRGNGSHGSITKTYGTGTNNFTYNGTSAQTTGSELPSSISTGTLTINNSSGTGNGVTLNAALSVDKLDMQNGTLNSSSSNTLTISNTSYTAVTRTGGWVNGPMNRAIPYGLVYVDRNRIYLFPVGKSTYNGFEMVSPVTRNSATFTCNSGSLVNTSATVEAFDNPSGGSAGSNFTALATNRYWKYSIGSPTCIFFSAGIRVFDSTASDTMAMGASTSQSGTYNNIGGFYYNNTLGGTQPIYMSLYSNTAYIRLGGKPSLSAGTYTVGNTGKNYQSLTSVANILHSRIITGDIIFEVYDNYSASDEIFPLIFWPFVVRSGDWHVTIRPNSGNSSDILTNGDPSSSTWHANYWPLVTLEGTRNLTFDGRKGGTGSTPAWTFRDESTTAIGPAFEFINDARNDSLKYLNIEGQPNNGGLIHVGGTSYTIGNDSNAIYYNNIRRRSDVGGTTYLYGVHMNGGMSTQKNDHTIIEGNNIENANLREIYILDSAMGNYLTIKNNHLYHNVNITTSQMGMELQTKQGPKNIEITGNYIGGSQAYCGGGYWSNAMAGTQSRGVRLNVDTLNTLIFHNNHIKNFKLTGSNIAFYLLEITNGKIDITYNELGDTSNDSSINVSTGVILVGISADSFTNLNIYKNQIGGIYNKTNAANSINYGMKLNSVFRPRIEYNGIGRIKFAPSATANGALINYGLFHSASRYMDSIYINKNIFTNLSVSDNGTGNSLCRAIYMNMNISSTGYINYNQINNIQNSSTGSTAGLTGMYLEEGSFKICHNMLTIKNENNTNSITADGILDISNGGRLVQLYYNSILIGGSISSGSNSSHAFRRTVGSTTTLRNNIFYNKRSGGTGNHLAIANIVSTPTTGWSATASMHNLLATNDTSKLVMWYTTLKSNTGYRISSSGDSTSWIYTTSDLPTDSLFSNENLNLNINTNTNSCWLANGKGKQVTNIYPGDYGDSATARNTNIIDGAPDIGADEFTPATTTTPPQLTVTGTHAANGTEIFLQGGRRIFELTWANTGTLPTLNKYVYYTGKWPNDTTNGLHTSTAKYMNCYIRIDTSGSSAGNNYQYAMKYYYDDALLGKIATEGNIILVKKQTNIASTWDTIRTTTRNTFANNITATGNKLRSFSEFTVTEDNNFALPLLFTNIYIQSTGENKPSLHWEVSNDGAVEFYQVKQIAEGVEKFYNTIPAVRIKNSEIYEIEVENTKSCYYIEAISNNEVLDKTILRCNDNSSLLNGKLKTYTAGKILYIETENTGLYHTNQVFQLYNLQGCVVKQFNVILHPNMVSSIDLSDISEGLYLISYNNSSQNISQKVMVGR
ncbi:MAG: hypothetical protein SGJ10_03150 [Bacteroidota bacterium]|nr:hypothetical protein [Bacteroidota bacterium]